MWLCGQNRSQGVSGGAGNARYGKWIALPPFFLCFYGGRRDGTMCGLAVGINVVF